MIYLALFRKLSPYLLALIIPVWIYALGVNHGRNVMQSQIDTLQADFAKYAADVGYRGKAAADAARVKDELYQHNKEIADNDHKNALAVLAADNEQLRNARARRNYVPDAPPASVNPGIACFDRSKLEQALQRLDDGVTGLLGEGDESIAGLNTAKTWAARF